ncbi:MAG: nucleotidyltransferase domain-containing protein [Methanocellales archaeon]|nr:nucleotidyltransferase domain-containing protein [Methanocellales archaeon]
MRFINYLEDILSTKSDIKILRTLIRYPAKEFNESELAEVAGVGQKTVNRAMPKYVSYGILGVRSVGKANVYTLDADHYIVKQLQLLFDAERRSKKELKSWLKKSFYGDKDIITVAVFGSVARGEEEPTSDIDIFVLTRNKAKAKRILERIGGKILKTFGNVVSPYVLTPQELKGKQDLLTIKEIKKYGELILGKPLEEVIQ